MRTERSRRATWTLVARATLLAVLVTGIVLALTFGTASPLMTAAPYLVYAAIGLLVTARQPQNPIGWLFLTIGAMDGVNGALYAVTTSAAGTPRADDWYVLLAAWAYNFVWLILLSTSTIFTLLLFPNGLMSSRWRPVLVTAAGATTCGVVLAAFAPELVVGDDEYPNPLHPDPWGPVTNAAFGVCLVGLLACGVLSVVAAVLRYRRARGVERLQMQWFASAAVMFAALLLISGVFSSHPFVGDLLFTIGASMIPLSCGLAILRYRLYDLGRIVSRTTSYAIVTALLVFIYAVVVTAAARLLPDAGSLAVAGATLAAAALARPLLHRVQDAVDRRFNRTRYDAHHTVDQFGAALRREIAGPTLNTRLVATVDEALQPSRIGLWLKETV